MKTNNHEPRLTRRDFCAATAGGLLGALAASTPWAAAAAPPRKGGQKSGKKAEGAVVSLVRDAGVWKGEGLELDQAALRKLLDRTVALAFGESSAKPVWRALFHKTDIVGIKVNCLGGASIATRPDLTRAVVDSLIEAGVPEGNIIVWERSDGELKHGGYPIQKEPGKVRYMGAPEMDIQELMAGSVKTKLCALVAKQCTALIDLPVIKAHDLAGFTCAQKNFVGAVPNASDFHPNQCEAVADLNAFPAIKSKLRLVVVDALRPLYDRGPGDFPAARYKYSGLLAGADPVAVDRVVQDLLEKKRAEVKGGPWPLKDEPGYMKRAAAIKLGETDLAKIKLLKEEKA